MEPRRFEDVELGDEFPFDPDVSMPQIQRFGAATGMTWGRFTDHEQAKKEGLPGAIVPGIMSQGILVAAIHRWAPQSEVTRIDTVFRATVQVDTTVAGHCVVTDLDPEAKSAEIDLTLSNEAGETRVIGTATVRL